MQLHAQPIGDKLRFQIAGGVQTASILEFAVAEAASGKQFFVSLPRNYLDIQIDVVDNASMFVREKIARGHRYLYLAESVREGGRPSA